MSIAYIPRIDHDRRQAIVVNRYPGKKVCAQISTRPLCNALRDVLPNASTVSTSATMRNVKS